MINVDKPLILDVGAHIGESVQFFKKIFPQCRIYSFEPFIESYKKLCQLQYDDFVPINPHALIVNNISINPITVMFG